MTDKLSTNSNEVEHRISDQATSTSRFARPGLLLFSDQMIVASAGWIFWIVISRLTSSSQIGEATALYNLVLLVSTISQLGLEFPLLKKSQAERHRIFGTVLFAELTITAISIPVVLYVVDTYYSQSQDLTMIAVGLLLLSSGGFVARFGLLGLSRPRTVLFADVAGMTLRFISGIILVSNGFGAMGILYSFLLQAAVMCGCAILIAKRSFGFKFGNRQFFREILRDGIVNTPAKMSNMLIVSLAVVLLAVFGTSNSDIGVFYIVMMVSIVAASVATSTALMSIPASSSAGTDLSPGSLRMGLGFTAPIIAALVAAPDVIMSTIGTEYVQRGTESLMILSFAILPSVIVSNALSRFNNLNKSSHLIVLGAIRLSFFGIPFMLMVPLYGTPGAAYSVLISLVAASVFSLIFSEKNIWKYVAVAIFSVLGAWSIGRGVPMLIGDYPVFAILIAMTFSIFVMLKARLLIISEIIGLLSRRSK